MTYTSVSSHLSLKEAVTTAAWSQPVAVGDGNRAIIDATVLAVQLGGADSWTLTIEQSNDLENWEALNALTITSSDTPGYYVMSAADSISMAYVRIAYAMTSLSTGDYLVVDSGISVFHV